MDCSQHKKNLFGEADMKVVAEAIGDLHYETLSDLLYHLSSKLYEDGKKDFQAGRTQVSHYLFLAQMRVHAAHHSIHEAWEISKPFMNDKQ